MFNLLVIDIPLVGVPFNLEKIIPIDNQRLAASLTVEAASYLDAFSIRDPCVGFNFKYFHLLNLSSINTSDLAFPTFAEGSVSVPLQLLFEQLRVSKLLSNAKDKM